ncbi:Crp/Fnr family transcriptional regulator [Fictibacillus macauensis ZFHKF-1]|uniref:Crp/Fnr family transcriptional regulator n=1 Tax=Fictibacillus macauensis ZFHKF-1 TaxID=1196324 RepID=I8UI22_9BACL|nr:Crp/Fnr family transcriptional regulator [Fictibacillus macauensis]EIT86453.1 Crp/Fnr family transcriptional regulator [Fictibacillus macauensis ZFHKF-1]
MKTCDIPRDYNAVQNTEVFSEETINILNELSIECRISKGTMLFIDHEPATKLYFVKEGIVKGTKVTEEGKELVLSMFQNGDLIGELNALGDEKYNFSAIASTDCVVGVIHQTDLEEQMRLHGEMALEFVRWTGLMHQITRSKLRDLMLYGKNGALCSTLIRLSNSYGKMSKDGITLTLQLTNAELAELVGTSRETVNRMLAVLKKDQIIHHDLQGNFVITDLHYLKNICNCEECPLHVCRI